MPPDWNLLAPNRPLDPGDGAYVPRPGHGADLRIADWILTGRSPVLVAGPVGVGKSTELAFAADAIGQTRVACLVRLDRTENMRTVTPDRVVLGMAVAVLRAVQGRGLPIDEAVLEELAGRLNPPEEWVGPYPSMPPRDLAHIALREAARTTGTKPCLLIDGLEKTPHEPASAVFEALAALHEDADLVVVIPFHAAFGPGAESVLAPGEKLVVVSPLEVEGEADQAGRDFLQDVVAKRLAFPPNETVPPPLRDLLIRAAELSGGVPRTFLQLVADAATYARAIDGEPWPQMVHLERAVDDQQDSFRRLLLPGDAEALRQADGSDGREVPLEQKLRLLSHGLLLERLEDGRHVMRPHPMVRPLLPGGAPIVY